MTSTSKSSTVALIFPPLTESRFFPYLSLPMLAAFLRANGVTVKTEDHNLALCHRLFTARYMERYLASAGARSGEALRDVYRVQMARYLLANQKSLSSAVFDRAPEEQIAPNDVRLVRQGIELLLEGSVLQRELTSLERISDLVQRLDGVPDDDLAASAQRELLDEMLVGGPPKVVALSIAFYSQILPSLILARWVKEKSPSTLVILGGQQVMMRHEALVTLPAVQRYVDCLGTGPGEETLLEVARFAQGLAPREQAPDAVWLAAPTQPPRPSTIHVRDLPTPDFDDAPLYQYLNSFTELGLITCVGCYWGRCTFCSYGNRSQRVGYQQKSPEQIANECEAIVKRYRVRRINFIDENSNLYLVRRAMQLLTARGVRIVFSVRNRLESALLSRAFCRELRDLGCILMSVGYETNSQRLLDLLDKGVKASDYQTIVDNLHEVGIPLRLSIMGGILDETPEELRASIEFLKKNADKVGFDVMQMLVCEPTTHLAERPELYNIRIERAAELRGNQRLSYGMGRMGYSFSYEDGDTFQARLDAFTQIYDTVHPGKNAEILPRHRPRKEATDDRAVEAIDLNPWVQVVRASVRPGSAPERVLVDLLWQAFYRLPEGIEQYGSSLCLRSMSSTTDRAALARLASLGVGRVIETKVSA